MRGVMPFFRKSHQEKALSVSAVLFPQSVAALATTPEAERNSAVSAVIGWVVRAFNAAHIRVFNQKAGGFVADHPLEALFADPNPLYGERLLRSGVVARLLVYGEAFILKTRSPSGRVVSLWLLPNEQVTVRVTSGSVQYSSVSGVPYNTGDIVHLRYRLGPDGVRGTSPLQSLLREVATDNEAAAFSATILKNAGIPGAVITPAQGSNLMISPADAEAIRATWLQRVAGESRGQPLVFTDPVEVKTFGFSPDDMVLDRLRRIPEERISAAFGVPAIVAGLGAGLERSTFNNYAEARESAFNECIVPLQEVIADELTRQLLSEVGETPPERVVFDNSGNDIYSRKKLDETKMVVELYAAGIISREEARARLGLEG